MLKEYKMHSAEGNLALSLLHETSTWSLNNTHYLQVLACFIRHRLSSYMWDINVENCQIGFQLTGLLLFCWRHILLINVVSFGEQDNFLVNSVFHRIPPKFPPTSFISIQRALLAFNRISLFLPFGNATKTTSIQPLASFKMLSI